MDSPKCNSEPDLSGCPNTDTPGNNVTLRTKRKRLQANKSQEITELREEMKLLLTASTAQLQAQMNKLFPILSGIQQSNTNIEVSIKFLAEENSELKNRILQLESDLKSKSEQMVLLEERLEEISRLKNNKIIEIKNVPLDENTSQETLIGMVNTLSNNLKISLSNADVCNIYSVKAKMNKKSVIVEFNSTITKDKILKTAKAHNLQNKTNKLTAGHLGLIRNSETPIYIVERLTPKASRLYFLARDLKNSKGYKYCWTSYGRVFVRLTDNAPVIPITNELQVQRLFND